jgi:peptidylprolyl isomerase/peptidyl-prolyl cis-trans isomerase C
MMNAQPQQAYLALKLSLNLFQKPPQSLDEAETARLREVAGRQAKIEAAILGSPEALNVVVPKATLETRLEEIRQRYPGRAEFLEDMRQNALSEAALTEAVTRDICIEAVLERIAAQAPPVSEAEAESYYREHPAAFTRPETRRIRHILMTFDDATQKEAALTCLEALREGIRNAEDFAAAALKHSQCPTALEGGVLGVTRRGQLFPELDAAAFALAEGELSTPQESPVGLHLLFCETIHPETTLSLADAKPRVIAHLTEARVKRNQEAWIKRQLRRMAPNNA